MGSLRRIRVWGAGAVSIPLLAFLAASFYGSRFIRPVADGFCTLGSLRALGYWGSQAYWYQSWSGRYAFTASVNAIELFGHRVYPWIGAFLVVAWLFALYLLYREIMSRIGLVPGRWQPGLLSLLSMFSILAAAPNFYQSFYWLTGMLTYAAPMMLLTALAVLALGSARAAGELKDRRPAPAVLVGFGLLGLWTAGFSETTTLISLLLLGMGVTGAAGSSSRGAGRMARILVAALFGVLIGSAIQLLSPGNEVRQALMPAPPDGITLIRRSARDVVIFLAMLKRDSPLILSLAIMVPLMIGLLSDSWHPGGQKRDLTVRGAVSLVGIPAACGLLIMAAFAATEYAQSSFPDGRVLLVPLYSLVLGISVWSLIVGRWVREILRNKEGWRVPVGALLFVVAFLIATLAATNHLIDHLEVLREMESFAAQWDTRHQNALQAVEMNSDATVRIASLPHIGGMAEIGREADFWVNRCFAQAYGLAAVVAK